MALLEVTERSLGIAIERPGIAHVLALRGERTLELHDVGQLLAVELDEARKCVALVERIERDERRWRDATFSTVGST